MSEILRKVGIHRKTPLERAEIKAADEASRMRRRYKYRDYIAQYETLAARVHRYDFTEEILNQGDARLRRGLDMQVAENRIGQIAIGTPAEGIPTLSQVETTAKTLQVVVRFSRNAGRTFPGKLKF